MSDYQATVINFLILNFGHGLVATQIKGNVLLLEIEVHLYYCIMYCFLAEIIILMIFTKPVILLPII